MVGQKYDTALQDYNSSPEEVALQNVNLDLSFNDKSLIRDISTSQLLWTKHKRLEIR